MVERIRLGRSLTTRGLPLPAGTKIVRNSDGNGFRLAPTDGSHFFPWERKGKTRDAAAGFGETIGERAKKRVTLGDVLAKCREVDARLRNLEASAPQPQTKQPARDQQQLAEGTLFKNPDGSLVFVPQGGKRGEGFMGFLGSPSATPAAWNFVPLRDDKSAQPTRDTKMRNPALAPNRHLTFSPHAKGFRDETSFGEKPSRFSSAEADRMARHIVGAGMPSAAELNASYKRAWDATGASGQMREGQRLGEAQGERLGATGQNKRSGMIEARNVNYSQNFAIPNPFEEFQNDVARPSPAALSALNAALASAKSQHEQEQLTQHWKAYMQTAQNDRLAGQRETWKPRQGVTRATPNGVTAKGEQP